MNPCDCSSRPQFFSIHPDELNHFLAGFIQVTCDPLTIYHLYRCRACGSHWLVDDMTRGPMAVRATAETDPQQFDERPYRRELCIRMHGGLDPGVCIFLGCRNQPLHGLVFCVDHQYPYYAP